MEQHRRKRGAGKVAAAHGLGAEQDETTLMLEASRRQNFRCNRLRLQEKD